MKKLCAKLAVLAAAIGFVGATHAAPVSYNFTATNFIAVTTDNTPDLSGAVPFDTISGSFTLDGATLTQIDLTIGSHTYALPEVGFDPISSTLGGTTYGIFNTRTNSDDFVLLTNGSSPLGFVFFGYTIVSDTYNNVYRSTMGTITPAVPVPASAWLLGSGLVGLAGVARKRKAA